MRGPELKYRSDDPPRVVVGRKRYHVEIDFDRKEDLWTTCPPDAEGDPGDLAIQFPTKTVGSGVMGFELVLISFTNKVYPREIKSLVEERGFLFPHIEHGLAFARTHLKGLRGERKDIVVLCEPCENPNLDSTCRYIVPVFTYQNGWMIERGRADGAAWTGLWDHTWNRFLMVCP